MTTKLLNDIARCHDSRCEVKHTCARYRLNDTGGPGTPHCMTMRPLYVCFDEQCDKWIEYDEHNES